MKKLAALLALISFTASCVPQEVVKALRHPAVASCTSELPTAVANLSMWVSADCFTNSGTCSTPSPGTISSSWFDQSGHGLTWGFHGTCTFVASDINGLPAVRFNGSTCYFTGSSSAATSPSLATFFAVWKNNSTASGTYIAGGPFQAPAYGTCNAGKQQFMDSQGFVSLGLGTAGCDTSWHQGNVVYVKATPSATYRLNESADATTGSVSNQGFASSLNAIGRNNDAGSNFLNADLAELFFYNTNVGSTDVTKLECYLKTKYGI